MTRVCVHIFFIVAAVFFGDAKTIYASASDYTCEIMSVDGKAFVIGASQPKRLLVEGDILKAGDMIEVAEQSHVDVAFDKKWNNVTRIFEKSNVKIKSIYPTGLKMAQGDVLAKLGKLPKNSTFEVETPTTVAAVRGSEFRTVCENGVTEVFNLHDSTVEVFGKNLEGEMDREATLLQENDGNHYQVDRPEVIPHVKAASV